MVSQRAGRSLSLRSEWTTSGGAATNPPEETVIVFASRPISKVQFALEDVEGIGVLVVNVRAGDLFARCASRVGDRDFLARYEDADLAILAPKDRLSIGDWDDHLRVQG